MARHSVFAVTTSVDTELQQVIDYHCVSQTLYRYASCVDKKDFASLRTLFTDDATGSFGFEAIVSVDPALLLRAVEVYAIDRLDFAEAYLVACAESTGVGTIASFDRSLDRVPTVERVEQRR
jgi:predicted nucleic acid-binding protein